MWISGYPQKTNFAALGGGCWPAAARCNKVVPDKHKLCTSVEEAARPAHAMDNVIETSIEQLGK